MKKIGTAKNGSAIYVDNFGCAWFGCLTPCSAETETIEKEATTPTAPVAPPADDKEADAEPRPTTGGAKPPGDGLCRNCRNRRRLNRFKLCYPCWVEAEITDREKREGREWKPGDPHPAWCHCEGLGEHKNDDGTAKGFN